MGAHSSEDENHGRKSSSRLMERSICVRVYWVSCNHALLCLQPGAWPGCNTSDNSHIGPTPCAVPARSRDGNATKPVRRGAAGRVAGACIPHSACGMWPSTHRTHHGHRQGQSIGGAVSPSRLAVVSFSQHLACAWIHEVHLPARQACDLLKGIGIVAHFFGGEALNIAAGVRAAVKERGHESALGALPPGVAPNVN